MESNEAIRQAWDVLLDRYGDHELERRMSKMESYRKYYRRWPFDGRKTVLDLDDLVIQSTAPSPENLLIAKEAAAELLESMSERQAEIAQLVADGYRLFEIAQILGDQNSGKVRWFYYTLKRQFGVPIQASKRRHGLPQEPLED